MTDLFEKSIRTLELPAVLEKLAAKAVSDAAKERCLRLTPATDTQEVLHLLDETDAAKERLGLHGSPSFSGVKDVSAALTRADHGGMLNTRELLDVAGVLTASRRVSEYDAQRQGEATVLDAVHGVVCCAACREKGGLAMPLSPAALAALRHVLYCPDKKLYSFTLDTPALRQLGQAAEVYVTAQLERSFRTLDYYKSILPQEEPTYD